MSQRRVVIQAVFTPLSECRATCSNNDCDEMQEFTLSVWPENEHGPFEEPVGFHACTLHLEEVSSYLAGTIMETLTNERLQYYTSISEGGEANE